MKEIHKCDIGCPETCVASADTREIDKLHNIFNSLEKYGY
jgi:hypothetical protein